ncbi:MAG: C39 family peptidase [Eggerthellaceae bacterium]|nr:C39 family peptidase [Eggerthellaceae bacterium]
MKAISRHSLLVGSRHAKGALSTLLAANLMLAIPLMAPISAWADTSQSAENSYSSSCDVSRETSHESTELTSSQNTNSSAVENSPASGGTGESSSVEGGAADDSASITGYANSPDAISAFAAEAQNVTVTFDFSGIDTSKGNGFIDIDGVAYPLSNSSKGMTVSIPAPASSDTAPCFATFYLYNNASDPSAYASYPTAMYVWRLSYDNASKTISSQRLTSLDNALKYAGCSVRTIGKAGVRVVTEVPKSVKAALVGSGIEGFTLVEYGTAVQWDSTLGSKGQSLTLDNTQMSSSAYKAGVADPIYKETSSTIKYTGVLVGFSDNAVSQNLSMRPYMKLRDGAGIEHVLYGGVVHRSIGYIASQNHDAFGKGTAGYKFIWKMIHLQYGSSRDSELGYVDWNICGHVSELIQNPELPWGCESVSLAIALRAMGYNVGKTEIYDHYLSHSTWDYVNAFAGNAYTMTGLGEAYPPAIVDAANRYLVQHGAAERAVNLSGASFETLLEYVDQGYPVLVWTTMYMSNPQPLGMSLYGYNAYSNEHCVVMYGHNGGIQVSDPLSGMVTRDYGAFASLYNRCGRYAVVIL